MERVSAQQRHTLRRLGAVMICMLAFTFGSIAAHATVRESLIEGVGADGVLYLNKSRIDNSAKNSQTVAWTDSGVKKDLAIRVRQYYQATGMLCVQSSYVYTYTAAKNITVPMAGTSCASGNFYSKGRTGFWRPAYSSYHYFDASRTSALTF